MKTLLSVLWIFSSLLTAQSRIDYQKEIKPILDRRCVVCHSCYNSPCQLKMEAFEGVDRGGSKIKVYDGTRLRNQDPTRLFVDAETTKEWRAKGFFSVTGSDTNRSVMSEMLRIKIDNPVPQGEYHAESDDLTCAKDLNEVERYAKKHPHGGMPFGFPPLSQKEYDTLIEWIAQGATGPDTQERQKLQEASKEALPQIRMWEAFLNHPDPKYAMSARYLYEHLFLAHIHFEGTSKREFYELVRSSTPSPEAIAIVPTLRPYDDPGVERVYYRFRKIHATIVHKTHMIFPMSPSRLKRIKHQFIGTKWLETPHRVGYDPKIAANPFRVFEQIPPSVRYRFLLDNSRYIVDTFIRGPVCKGQIALNVIEDHFWVMFMDPKFDLSVRYPGFLMNEYDNLRLPTERGSDWKVWKAFSDQYRDRYEAFYRDKMKLYSRDYPGGLPIEAVWQGERESDEPVLSVYRHFDSASVEKGVLGNLPKTLWVMDYPQFERLYYALVAGFDVFGNVAHQTNVRRYMDYLRMEGEMNFLQFLPPAARYPILQSWYIGEEIENVRFAQIGSIPSTGVEFRTKDPKRELIERLVNHRFRNIGGFDPINYYRAGEQPPPMPKKFARRSDYLQGFRALNAPGTGFIREINEYGVDLLHLRIRNTPEGNMYITMVINRWHDNVNALFMERNRLDPSKDTIEFFTRNIGSYPNYFFDIDVKEVPDFLRMMAKYDGSIKYRMKIKKYGVNRSDPRFWEIYDDFQAHFDESEPIDAGLYDLNRYYYLAF